MRYYACLKVLMLKIRGGGVNISFACFTNVGKKISALWPLLDFNISMKLHPFLTEILENRRYRDSDKDKLLVYCYDIIDNLQGKVDSHRIYSSVHK